MVSKRQTELEAMPLKSLKVVWSCCEAAFGGLSKEDLIFLMILLNRVGEVKIFVAVGLFVCLHRRTCICFKN